MANSISLFIFPKVGLYRAANLGLDKPGLNYGYDIF